MNGPMIRHSVPVLKSPCPTCGCEAYDGTHDEAKVARFVRRLAWAGSVLGLELTVRGRIENGKWTLKHIDIKGGAR